MQVVELQEKTIINLILIWHKIKILYASYHCN